jgi:ribosomal protein S18 acetylase RimI-like enzyme
VLNEARTLVHGAESYEAEVFDWLCRPKGSEPGGALDDIAKNKTLVWLYRDDGKVVGFGALAPEQFRFPQDDGPEVEHLQIVYLGVDERCRGRRYARAILSDLLAEANERCDAAIVSLFVHEKNHLAIKIYQNYGFEFLSHVNEQDASGTVYLAMYTRIREETEPLL